MSALEKLESQKTLLLRRLAGWPPAQLSFRPEPSAWCALDVLSHLVNVESNISKAIRSHLPDGVPVSIKDKAGAVLVNSVMRSPIRVKVPPTAKAALPKPVESLEEVSAEWLLVREEWQRLLGSLPAQADRRGFFRHPVAGWMSVPTTIDFLSAHLQHHGYQIDRLECSFGGSGKL
jgi:hypothetical protein